MYGAGPEWDRGTKGIGLLIIAVICWHVWKERNIRIFNNLSHSTHIYVVFILCDIVFVDRLASK